MNETEPWLFEAILDEVDQVHNVGARLTIAGNVRTTATVLTRLEGLAEQHPPVLEALVLVATKLQGGDGYTLTPATKPV